MHDKQIEGGEFKQGAGQLEGHDQFDKVLTGLLRADLRQQQQIPGGFLFSLATLEDEVAEELVPRLELILQHLLGACGKYQRWNLQIVYDTIGILADAIGGD